MNGTEPAGPVNDTQNATVEPIVTQPKKVNKTIVKKPAPAPVTNATDADLPPLNVTKAKELDANLSAIATKEEKIEYLDQLEDSLKDALRKVHQQKMKLVGDKEEIKANVTNGATKIVKKTKNGKQVNVKEVDPAVQGTLEKLEKQEKKVNTTSVESEIANSTASDSKPAPSGHEEDDADLQKITGNARKAIDIASAGGKVKVVEKEPAVRQAEANIARDKKLKEGEPQPEKVSTSTLKVLPELDRIGQYKPLDRSEQR